MPAKKKGLAIDNLDLKSGTHSPRASDTPRGGGGGATTPRGAKGKPKNAESPANKGAAAAKEGGRAGAGSLEDIEKELRDGVIVGGGLKLLSGGEDDGISMMDAAALIAMDELSQPQSQAVQKISVWNKIHGLQSSIRIMTAKDQVKKKP